jgi:hypothetical protein
MARGEHMPIDKTAMDLTRSRSNGNANNTKRGALVTHLDTINEVGGLPEARCREVAILFVMQDQSFSHGLREL